MKTHTQNARNHAKRRSLQRFGFELSRADRKEVERQIAAGKTYIATDTNTRTWHLVNIRGVRMLVLWSKTLRSPVTVLNSQSRTWQHFEAQGRIKSEVQNV